MGIDGSVEDSKHIERRLHELQFELAHVSTISAVGTLAAVLAHELNQPLTAIANYVETARDLLNARVFEREVLREALEQAAMQSLRAGEIVRRLRDFIARGQTEKSVHSLKELVSEANALALVGIGPAELDVRLNLDPDADLIFVDRLQIQQVFLNLVGNALHALADVPIKRLDISSVAVSDGLIEIVVADSGSGLSAEAEATLFEPFRSTKDSGMGLGLSICRTIIEGQSGRIWVKSSPLGGTSFHFTLTRAESVPNAA